MAAPIAPVSVSILAFPEATASVVYGYYDLFLGAGRDWGVAVHGRPGPSLMRASVVARAAGPIEAANGVTIHARASCGSDGSGSTRAALRCPMAERRWRS